MNRLFVSPLLILTALAGACRQPADPEALAAEAGQLKEATSAAGPVTVAEAQRDTLRVTIQHTWVASPITGAVARRLVSSGEHVRTGGQLFTLVAEEPLKLRGDVPERFAHEREVRTSTRGGAGVVEITEGLEPNESVATSGFPKLENGIAVTVKEAEPPNRDQTS
jgi:multidrug efflux pump subunit AcrA (membrane-fusion protein)